MVLVMEVANSGDLGIRRRYKMCEICLIGMLCMNCDLKRSVEDDIINIDMQKAIFRN